MKNYSRIKPQLTLLLCLLFVGLVSVAADTVTFGSTNGGYSAPDGTPCATTLNCGNATPRGFDYLIRDQDGNLLSTIRFNPSTAQIETNLPSAATINLGSFSFTGALPPPALYTFFLASVPGVTTTPITITALLSFTNSVITVTTSASSSLLNLANGTSLRVFGTTTGRGQLALNVLNPATAVPEPAAFVLLLSGLGGLIWRRRQRAC